ncbi:MAG: hypothetical protein DWQ11_18065 [Proteobacteria bacterium]|nr:MAG: hypothetical protein DWQ11_18065 [Pseudomonadota bacterium]
MPLSAQAAGLGRISVLSALGQPLRAEIELNATADEVKSMTAAVAAPEAFKAAKLSYAPALTSIRMAVEQRGGKPYVRLSSAKPVNDPFVSLLVELNWQSGRLLREYTFLLDPPAMPAPAASADVAAPPVAQPRATAARPIGGQAADRYTVRRGDTLGKIAGQHLPQGVAMDQMLVALYRKNPDAFVDNNVNRLRSGVILNVPDAAEANAIPQGEARREIVAHAADFAEYRRRIAARVADATPEEAPASQSSSGKITAKVEEPALPSAAAKDQVKVSKTVDEAKPAAEAGGGALDGAAERLKSLEEDLVARDKALREATDRLAALEANIAELQKLIALKNENLAALQKQASATPAPAPAVEPPPAPPVAQAPAPAVEAKPESPASAAQQDALDKELKALVAAEPTAPAADAPAAAEAPAPVAAAPEPAPAPAPVPAPAPAAPPPPAEPSFLESLLANPTTLYGGGGILALLLGYGLLRSRKNRAAGAPEATAMASVFPPDQNSVFGETGGQSVDTGSSSLIQTDFSQSGLSAIDADEGVDPVAEADVYMAYGRDAQAEEILLDALKGDPNRTAVHLKLMEIYGQRKNMKQFETTATELYSVTGGNGPDWAKAAEMGRKLDPDNPLFLRGPQSEIDLPLDEALPADEDFKAEASPDDSMAFSAPAAEVPVAPKADVPADLDAPSDIDAAIDGDDDAEMSLDLSASVPNPDAPSPSQLKDTWAIPGDLNQFSDSDLEAAASAQLDEAPELADAASETLPEGLDAGELDFDLELDEPAEPPAADAASMEATEVAGRTLNDSFTTTDTGLEFNLDLAEPDAAADASLDSTRVDGVGDADADLGTVSDLEFDADTAAGGAGEAKAATEEATAKEPAEDMPDAGSESVVDLEKTNFDGSLLDFDFDLDEAKTPEGEDNPMMATSLDLSDISLDLEGADDTPATPSADEALSVDTDAVPTLDERDAATSDELEDTPPVFDEPAPADTRKAEADAASQEDDMMASLSKSVVTSLTDSRSMPDLPDDDELNQEVDTKLELARAYEEMGDAEGARELLEEVIRDGNDAQQEQARAVFARLG